jgi:GAF domain-containing protein
MDDTAQQLSARIAILEQDLALRARRCSELEHRLKEADDKARGLQSRFSNIEAENAQLANLYVASYRLHESLVFDEVLQVIHEIVINLVGSEEFVIYELAADGKTLVALSAFGVAQPRDLSLEAAGELVGQAIRDGQVVTRAGTADGPVLACVPLRLHGRTFGAIAIASLLEHKPGLNRVDHELFELLATHAAAALHCCRLAAAGEAGA